MELYIKGYDIKNKPVQLVIECECMRYQDEYCCEHEFEIIRNDEILLMEDNNIFYYRKSPETVWGHLYVCLRNIHFECMTKEFFKKTHSFQHENIIRIY